MALAERFATGAGSRPDGVTCELFEAPAGTKRCSHYVGRGACGLEGEFMCTEWLRVNGHPSHRSLPLVREAAPEPPPVERDLFGNPIEPPRPAAKPRVVAEVPGAPTRVRAQPAPAVEEPTGAPLIVRTLTDDDVAAFEKLGAEVCLQTASCGELWLVPSYTHTPGRQEISVHDAATLAALCAAFPGSQVVGFTPAKKLSST